MKKIFQYTIYLISICGVTGQGQNAGKAEMSNMANSSVMFDCLSYQRHWSTAITKNDNGIFFTSPDWGNEVDFSGNLRKQFDIYNTIMDQWSVGVPAQPIMAPGIINLNNSLCMGMPKFLLKIIIQTKGSTKANKPICTN